MLKGYRGIPSFISIWQEATGSWLEGDGFVPLGPKLGVWARFGGSSAEGALIE